METNISEHVDSLEDKVNCPYCAKSFTRKGLKCHITRMHPEINLSSSQSNEYDLFASLCKLKSSCKMLRRIPKGARITATSYLTTVIKKCIDCGSIEDWEHLILLSYKNFRVPSTYNPAKTSLTAAVKKNLAMVWANFAPDSKSTPQKIKKEPE